MPGRVVVDTGPLVALFDRSDQFHRSALSFLREFEGDGLTTLAVVTEVTYLLNFNVDTQTDFLDWIQRGALTIVDLREPDFEHIIRTMRKYRDVPADFADASLVAIADRLNIQHIATLDDDFRIYRYKGRLPFRNVFPADD